MDKMTGLLSYDHMPREGASLPKMEFENFDNFFRALKLDL